MIELANANAFIKNFEFYGKKIYRIPLTYFNGRKVNILMCKCGSRWISLPYMSEGVIETQNIDLKLYPFALFESEEGNLCATTGAKWEIRDRKAYSNHLYSDKVNFVLPLRQLKLPIVESYSPNIRHKIRKALANGLIVECGDKRLLNSFCKVYFRRMYSIGVCPSSKNYIRKRLICGNYWLFVVFKDNKPVGAASLQRINEGIMENEFFATDSNFNNQYTSYLLHYTMMQFAHSEDCDYSLGRSTCDSSVYHYKQHFKAETYRLFWSYSHHTNNVRNSRFLYRLWRLLPYRLTMLLAPVISRHIY